MYTNYMAWQRDEDGKYLTERKSVPFTDWLDRLAKGEDVGYHLWVVTEKGKGYPNERIYVDPHQFLNLDVYFTELMAIIRVKFWVWMNFRKKILLYGTRRVAIFL